MHRVSRWVVVFMLALMASMVGCAMVFTWFSFSLTDPNLTFFTWAPFWQFQWNMWATIGAYRPLLVQWYVGIISVWSITYLLWVWLGTQLAVGSTRLDSAEVVAKVAKNGENDAKTVLRKVFLPCVLWMCLLIFPLLFANNALSHDVFNYMMNAKMVWKYQADPHQSVAQDFGQDEWVRFMHNVHTPAPYGYGWTAISLVPSLLGMGKFLPTWLLFKLWSVLSYLLLIAAWWFFAEKYWGDTRARAVKFFALLTVCVHPLLLLEVIGNVHNDLWMMAPAMLSVALVLPSSRQPKNMKRVFFSLLALVFSFTIKFSSLVLLPIWLAMVLQPFLMKWLSRREKKPHAVQTTLMALLSRAWASFSPFIADICALLFLLPLLTDRSQQFHPWYFTWVLIWLPFVRLAFWRRALMTLSFSSLLRYAIFLQVGEYSDPLLARQKIMTWAPFVLWLLGEGVLFLWRAAHSRDRNSGSNDANSSVGTTAKAALATAKTVGQKNFTKLQFSSISSFQKYIWPFVLWGTFLTSRLWHLGQFPVFADEAIYIRWTQLLIDDPARYAFFAMNDGKTPLFVWLMVPLQYLFADQLLAGRIASVFAGALGVYAIGKLVRELMPKNPILSKVAQVAVVLLPFFLHLQRMALMDSLLSAFAVLALAFAVRTASFIETWLQKPSLPQAFYKWIPPFFAPFIPPTHVLASTILTGVFFGLALWSKLPALLIFPALFLTPWLLVPWSIWYGKRKELLRLLLISAAPIIFGLGMLALLKVHPAFPQLFRRSGDFTLSSSEFWQWSTFGHFFRAIGHQATILSTYLSPAVLLFAIIGLFLPSTRRVVLWCLFTSCCYLLPLALFGKTVYPRYLLPAAFPLVIAGSAAVFSLWQSAQNATHILWKRMLLSVSLAFLLSNIVATGIGFGTTLLSKPDLTPFVPADRVQYLEEWSSGHGIRPTVALLRALSENHTLAVATEGSFGTLPDGLTLFFHQQNVQNLWIDGIGQPVYNISESFRQRAKTFDQTVLVVNSHRRKFVLPTSALLLQACRPNNAPCLEVWDVTSFIKSSTALPAQ